jgi:hypothetical protein
MAVWLYLAVLSLAPQDIINSLKEYQRALGLPQTGNFQTASETRQAYYRCYYTGKLELPDSYEQLRLVEGTASGCAVNDDVYDVFFYPIEAVADGAAPVTSSLRRAAEERQAVVVAHEDYHEMLHRLPVHLAEAAATLAGFATAAQFARDTAGPDSELSRALVAEADLFLEKAEIVNRFHARLREVYQQVRAGRLRSEEALTAKRALFTELERECRAIAPKPRTFNPCPAVLNNAGLAFDYTYTKYYPLLHRWFTALEHSVPALVKGIRELAVKDAREPGLVAHLEARIHQIAGSSGVQK